MIQKYGGLDDFVVDPFGFKYKVFPANVGNGKCHEHNHNDQKRDGVEL